MAGLCWPTRSVGRLQQDKETEDRNGCSRTHQRRSLGRGNIMIRIKQVMAIARAETRITRRLARYWVFLILAFLIAIIYYFILSYVHGFFSSYSSTIGAVSPRFLMSIIGVLYALIFLAGTIFLAFDIRARDKRERMIEVLDSRPYSNLELILGRFVGIFLCSWIPIVVLSILLEILGIILQGLEVPMGEPIEILSLFSFVFLMAIPAWAFAIALVFLVTLLVRNRLAAAVILLVLIGSTFWAIIWLPAVYGAPFDITGVGAVFFCSEIAPLLTTPDGWLQRFSVLFAAFSLLGFSAAVHPRLDGGSCLKLFAVSTMVLMVALLLVGAQYYIYMGYVKNTETWKEAHAAIADEIVPDVRKISGNIKILPGKDLFLDLDITFEAPDEGLMQKALFTLNPGQEVKSAGDTSGQPIAFTHENGLLEVSLPQPMGSGEETTVHLLIQGVPDNDFAFLESAFSIMTTKNQDTGDVGLLGIDPGVFRNDFIALMPGLRWLPASGPEKRRDDPRTRSVDFFFVDLKVNLPGGWLAAGPGRRHKVEGNSDGVSFRFSPPAPVPEVALIASRFESRSMEVEGVTLEVLIHRKHLKNIEVLAETGEKIREWMGDRLKEAEEYGLSYPYDAITLVEVPNFLRTYGGGWRMDTAMAPPGMLLMRETGFPTSRFDVAFRKPEDFKDREGGVQQAKWERLKTFFMNDFSGGNVLSGGARNFFLYQTSAKGPEGLALNYIMEALSNLLITETKSYFSAHMFLDGNSMDGLINMTANSYGREPLRTTSMVDQTMGNEVSRPEVWDQALGVSLKDMDPWEDPARTVDVLTLKANAIAQSILDTLGNEKTGQLLNSIRESHIGKSFSLNDMVEAGKALGHDLTEILGDWFGSTDLPGFVCEKAKIYRISDSEAGSPRYQMLFTIRNDESAPGFFNLGYLYWEEGGKTNIVNSDPIRLAGKSAVRFGKIVSNPPAAIYLNPYLSLNRSTILLPITGQDAGKIVKAEAIEGLENLPYSLPQEDHIVVDDLDPGFSVIEEKKSKRLRLIARRNDRRSLDQGLPITNIYRIPPTWSRAVYTSSFGIYRQTFAMVRAGNGEKKAMFKTDINQADQWNLELHLPWKFNILGRKWGTYHLVITDSSGKPHEIEFDSNAAVMGWNLAGSVDLPRGETSLTISNKTDGQFVVADAIRWSPSAGK
jgi:ABC-type transport system involved in multi-copper enzyme maturation permease subunit